jgi:hypothetical protein
LPFEVTHHLNEIKDEMFVLQSIPRTDVAVLGTQCSFPLFPIAIPYIPVAAAVI